jgi:putative transposase
MADWPHAPPHRLSPHGTYMVTAGTFGKKRLMHDEARLSLVCNLLLELAAEYRWGLQAWAVLANHYHFVASAMETSGDIGQVIRHLHSVSARELNRLDVTAGRRVWFQFWDTRLTYQASFLARLHYVHQNAVHHGVVERATDYPWSSAAWFERKATAAFYKTVTSFKIDRLKVEDEFRSLECGSLLPLS